MCTCGIDMATQQARPATTSSACRARGDSGDGCTGRLGRSARLVGDGCGPPQHQHQRHHGDQADAADRREGEAPAPGLHRIGHDERPERAGEIVAGGCRRNRHAAAANEPVRNVGDQRPEHRRGSGADQHALDERELQHRRRQARPAGSRRPARPRRSAPGIQ